MSINEFSRVAANMQAMEAEKTGSQISRKIANSRLKMSTGQALNKSEDDPASLIKGENLSVRARGLGRALSNIGDSRSSLKIAEGGLNNILGILQAMKEKATQASSDVVEAPARSAIEDQLKELAFEIDSIVNDDASFNGSNLLDGTFVDKSTQVGDTAGDVLNISIPAGHDSGSLHVNTDDIKVYSSVAAGDAVVKIDDAISTVNESIMSVGSMQSRLAVKENAVSSAITETDSAKSRIMDTEMLKEQLEITKNNILQKTALVMMAQANVSPQNVMQLL